MSIKDRFSKERIARFFDREGFYIVLFLCVCVVAVTAVWVSRTGKNGKDISGADDNRTTVEAPAKDIPADTTSKPGIPASGDVKASTGEKTSTPSNSTAAPSEPAKATNASPAVKFSNPIKDTLTEECLIRMFSPSEVVWYENPGEFRTHAGLDIRAYEGTEVLAAYNGKVIDVRDDNDNGTALGWTVTIDHGNGLLTVYSNLDENIAVKKNDVVKTGQKIGVVGSSSIYEKELSKQEDVESHLHYEVLKKGKPNVNVDPESYLTVEK